MCKEVTDNHICEEVFKELCDCFIEIMAQNSSVPDLPESLKKFVDKHAVNFEIAQNNFDTCYNKVDLYISEKFNDFIKRSLADSEFNVFSINIDCLIDSSSYMNDYYKQNVKTGICVQESDMTKFCIQDEIVTIIQIISNKLVSFQNSTLFTEGMLKNNNVSNVNDIKKCEEEVKTAQGQIETLNTSIAGFEQKLNSIVQTNTEALNKEVKKVEFRIKKSEKKVHETSITVLGIFSAIVLTFNTIIGLFASTMQSLANANTYKFLLILLLIGLTTANILFGLYYFLKYIHQGKQDEEFDVANSQNKNNVSKIISSFFEILKYIMPMIITNVVIITMIILLLYKWDEGFIEKRNDKVYQQYYSQTESSGSSQEGSNDSKETNSTSSISDTTN